MEEDKKKKVMLGLIILCLILAISITAVTNMGGSGSSSRGNEPVQMLCMNEECGAEFELSTEEYREQMMQGGMMGPGPMAQTPIECPECGMQSAFRAVKCKECGTNETGRHRHYLHSGRVRQLPKYPKGRNHWNAARCTTGQAAICRKYFNLGSENLSVQSKGP